VYATIQQIPTYNDWSSLLRKYINKNDIIAITNNISIGGLKTLSKS